MKRFLTWLGQLLSPDKSARADLRQSGARMSPARMPVRPADKNKKPKSPDVIEFSSESAGKIEDGGPGKNVLIRNRYVREDSGTHDNLKILDDSILKTTEEEGFDPYNTGRFDRSKNWNSR